MRCRKAPFARSLTLLFCLSSLASAEAADEAAEPQVKGQKVIQLMSSQSLTGWKAPSSRWSIKDGVITGDTKGEKLATPEWI